MTIVESSTKLNHFKLANPQDIDLIFIIQMFCSRLNDDQKKVTQFLGSAVIDISQCKPKSYRFLVQDCSTQPHLKVGQIQIQFTALPTHLLMPSESSFKKISLKPHIIQSPEVARKMFSAAEENLKWIEGFSPKGLRPIVHGLHWVHSPYYVNHIGITLPSGAFCMIPTLEENVSLAVRSYKQRLQIALSRNTMKSSDFINGIADMVQSNIKSKHIRCLTVIADMLTLHTKMDVRYTPDVSFYPEAKSTERWEIPREPDTDGNTSFSGDCEDYAREIYQHCKEIRKWIIPKLHGTPIQSLAVILHMYVPTIEQGAVDRNAHSKYITYEALYRNHIWAALHPRDAWRTKCTPPCSIDHLYEQWPLQKCEKTLPVLHLEGTGEVYPVVTTRKPGFIAKIQNKRKLVENKWSELEMAETPDMSLQCEHQSSFYKYPIACMTDLFSTQGILDFTYITNNDHYGVSIYDWARGQYSFRPSTVHSDETMNIIKRILNIERPITPILTKSRILKTRNLKDGYALRYGQKTPFEKIPSEAGYAIYRIGDTLWHELYFTVGKGSGTSSSMDEKKIEEPKSKQIWLI